MKTIAYTALHYGRDYLYWAIKSVIDYVDEYHVIYSPIGSHGSRTDAPCPDTRAELYFDVFRAAGNKMRWHDGEWAYEGAQRDSIHDFAPDADVILTLDADEIWPYGSDLPGIIRIAQTLTEPVRRIRLPMVHFWRSFHKAVLHDPAYPERIIFPKAREGSTTLSGVPPIAHMGYAQRSEIVRYKLLTHGHRGEFRRDVDWLSDVFMANRQTDCHPVGSEYWNPEDVNPANYLPSFMKDHPYYGLAVIE